LAIKKTHIPLLTPIVFLPLAFLWFVLINHLRVEWTLNPQYSYGWAVPFLCAYLIWRNFQAAECKVPLAESGKVRPSFLYFLLALFAVLYAPTRLIQEANPDWRFISWTLAVEVIGITLCVLRLSLQPSTFLTLVFPVGFFLVAVPWPSLLEQFLIQGLTRVDARATTELLGWLGVPAVPHGNVIEVATGQVGIDEACSGIRSFQATLMISLFLGEFYRLNFSRRLLLVLGGFALSFAFNLARMSLLVWVAAHQGISAIAVWHDPAGVTILVACFFGLWGLGEWFGKKRQAEKLKLKNSCESEAPTRKANAEISRPRNKTLDSTFSFSCFSVFLALWIPAVEVSIQYWYRSHETRLPAAQPWTVVWPANQSAFMKLPIPAVAREILRYDEGRSAAWQEDGVQWQAIFLRWNPGSAAQHLAQNHTPEVCLTAAGHALTSVAGLHWFDVHGLHLPFRIYRINDTPNPSYVFYCLWDDRATAQGFATASLTWGSRLAPVMAGRRNPGQRSLEMALTGNLDESQAEAAFKNQLQKIIQVGSDRPEARH
jgi:exosortase